MISKLQRLWRIIATGISFALFGVGGVFLGLIVFPLISLIYRKPKQRITKARRTIQNTFRFFIEFMRVVGVLDYQLIGLEKLNRNGLLILANHPTLIDIVFLVSLVNNADCVVKAALWDNMATGGPVRAASYIRNDGGVELVGDCVRSLESGGNLVIFPEGTRTPMHGAVPFQRGAANIAVRGKRNITPILISCQPPSLRKGEPWWQVPRTRMQFKIEVQPDIEIETLVESAASEAIAARRLTAYLETYFSQGRPSHVSARSGS